MGQPIGGYLGTGMMTFGLSVVRLGYSKLPPISHGNGLQSFIINIANDANARVDGEIITDLF
jgi:hypothetical protein